MYDTDFNNNELKSEQLRQWEKFTSSGSVADYLEYRKLCRNEISEAFNGIQKEESAAYADKNRWDSTQRTEI